MKAAPAAPPFTADNLRSALLCLAGGGGGAATVPPPGADAVKRAETALLSWESSDPNAYASALLDLMEHEMTATTTGNVGPALCALLSLKAAVHRRWRSRGRASTGDAVMDDATKTRVREFFLAVVTAAAASSAGGEDGVDSSVVLDKSIQASACVVLAKIARLDVPVHFPTLLPTLFQHSLPPPSSEGEPMAPTVTMMNSASALESIISELSTKRLLVDRNFLTSVAVDNIVALASAFGRAMRSTSISRLDTQFDQAGKRRFHLTVRYASVLSRIVRHLLVSSLPTLVVTREGDAATGGGLGTTAATFPAVSHVFSTLLEALPGLATLCWEASASVASSASVTMGSTAEEDMEELLHDASLVVVEVQHAHPVSFAPFLVPFLHLFYSQLIGMVAPVEAVAVVGGGRSSSKFLPSFAIDAVRFLGGVASCSEYDPDERCNEAVEALRSRHGQGMGGSSSSRLAITAKGGASLDQSSIEGGVHAVWVEFFTPDRLIQLAEICVTRLMPLTRDRLEVWDADPEEFYLLESSLTAEESVQAAAQSLYLALIESKIGRSVIAPHMASVVHDFEAQLVASSVEAAGWSPTSQEHKSCSMEPACRPLGDPKVLLWDAIYTAEGMSANVLDGYLDLAAWFQECLGPSLMKTLEETTKTPYLPILRHRIVWLIGCHANKLVGSLNPHSVLLTILEGKTVPNADLVVRLAAVEALTCVLNESTSFDHAALLSTLAPNLLSSLYRTLNDCNEIDNKIQVLSLISLILLHIGDKIDVTTANVTIEPLCTIWQSANEQNLLRKEVLSIATCLARAVGSQQAVQLYPIAIPMIDDVLDPRCHDESVYLIEDALRLWLTLLRLARSYDPNMHGLFGRMVDVVQRDFDHLRTLMLLTEGYILLGGQHFLTAHSAALSSILVCVVGNVRPRGAAYVGLVLEALMRKFPLEGGVILFRGGIMGTMLESCASNCAALESCEPDRVVVQYLTTIARSLLAAPQLLDNCFPVTFAQDSSVFKARDLANAYFKLFDSIGHSNFRPLWRRLWAILLVHLLPPTDSVFSEHILQSMDDVVNVCVDLLTEEKESDKICQFSPYAVECNSDEEEFPLIGSNYEEMLLRDAAKDVAHTTNVRTLVRTKMALCAECVGQQVYNETISTVEPVSLQKLRLLI